MGEGGGGGGASSLSGRGLGSLLRLKDRLDCTPIFGLRFCISLFTELEVPSLALSGALILSILCRNSLIEELIKFTG